MINHYFGKLLIISPMMLRGLIASIQIKVDTNPTTIGSKSNFESEATNGFKSIIQKNGSKIGIDTTMPVAILHISHTEMAPIYNTNIHGICKDVNITK